jgi:hypothetical protein
MVISQKEMPCVFFLSPPFRSVLFVLVVMASAGASFGQVAISITVAPHRCRAALKHETVN